MLLLVENTGYYKIIDYKNEQYIETNNEIIKPVKAITRKKKSSLIIEEVPKIKIKNKTTYNNNIVKTYDLSKPFETNDFDYILDNKIAIKTHKAETIARLLYSYAQRTINKQEKKEFADYPSWKMKIKQIDLFKMNHWDNPAKRSSLKWIQYTMDWYNIVDMPIIGRGSLLNTM